MGKGGKRREKAGRTAAGASAQWRSPGHGGGMQKCAYAPIASMTMSWAMMTRRNMERG